MHELPWSFEKREEEMEEGIEWRFPLPARWMNTWTRNIVLSEWTFPRFISQSIILWTFAFQVRWKPMVILRSNEEMSNMKDDVLDKIHVMMSRWCEIDAK